MLTAPRGRPWPTIGRAPAWLANVDARTVLVGVIALAVAVRAAAIGSRLHIDDAYSWLVASAGAPHAFLHQLAASENSPPLFYLLLAPLPSDPAWLRAPAAVPGVLMALVAYLALRRDLGRRTALLTSLAVAVSPFLVTYSDVARGFMLADLALLVALWAMLELRGARRPARWWAVYLIAGVVAVYSEYDSAIFLLALSASALWAFRAARPHVAILGPLPIVALAPWIPQLIRAQHQVNVTKLAPSFAPPSLTTLRDAAATLALGENGGTSSSAGRWLVFAVILALGALAGSVLWRTRGRLSGQARSTVRLLAGTAALTLIGHAIAGAAGVDLFNQRYLTVLIPLGAALAAAALVAAERPGWLLTATVLLLGLGLFGVARRYHGEYEPDFRPVAATAFGAHPRAVLTNTPVVLYYLHSLRPQLDRPYNLGPGRARSCARPCLIIDDTRVRGGSARAPAERAVDIGPYALTLER